MRTLTSREIASHKNWYRDAREIIGREYPDDPELFIGLLAATSPRMSVKKNWRTAEMIYRSLQRGGPINYGHSMRTHHPNIGRAVRGEKLSGDKVEAFRQNLLGSDNDVTIDVWMCRWFGSDNSRITTKQYKDMSDKCKRNARSYNLTPAEYQAVAWSAIRSDNGLATKSFAGIWRSLHAQMMLWDLE